MMTALVLVTLVALLALIGVAYQVELHRDLRKSEAAAWDQVDADSEKIQSLEKLLSIPPSYWLVGQYKSGKPPYVAWDMVGIFASKELALTFCTGKAFFIAQIRVDEDLLKDLDAMPKIEYPLVKEAK